MDISIEPVTEHNVDDLIRMLLDLARYERLRGPTRTPSDGSATTCSAPTNGSRPT